MPPKRNIEAILTPRRGVLGIHADIAHIKVVLTAGKAIIEPTRAQYPKPAMAMPIPTAKLASEDRVSITVRSTYRNWR